MLYFKVAIVVYHCRAESELLDVYCENRDYPKVIRTLVKIFPIHFVILEDLIISMKVSKKKTEIIRCSIFQSFLDVRVRKFRTLKTLRTRLSVFVCLRICTVKKSTFHKKFRNFYYSLYKQHAQISTIV
jgi:hypothetical protein